MDDTQNPVENMIPDEYKTIFVFLFVDGDDNNRLIFNLGKMLICNLLNEYAIIINTIYSLFANCINDYNG